MEAIEGDEDEDDADDLEVPEYLGLEVPEVPALLFPWLQGNYIDNFNTSSYEVWSVYSFYIPINPSEPSSIPGI